MFPESFLPCLITRGYFPCLKFTWFGGMIKSRHRSIDPGWEKLGRSPNLVGGDWNHGILCSHVSGESFPTDELIFFKMVETTNQPKNRDNLLLKWLLPNETALLGHNRTPGSTSDWLDWTFSGSQSFVGVLLYQRLNILCLTKLLWKKSFIEQTCSTLSRIWK